MTLKEQYRALQSKKKKPARSEESLQISISQYICTQYPDVIFTAESSGIRVSIGTARKMKRQRSKGKHLDVNMAEARGGYFGLYIELKDESPWTLSGELKKKINKKTGLDHLAEQDKMIKRLKAKGYYATFAVGFDNTKNIIDKYMSLQPTKPWV